jgi:small conductance mechanosensitive channel
VVDLRSIPEPAQPADQGWEAWSLDSWGPWLSTRLLHALLFLLGAFLLDQLWRMILRRVERAAEDHDPIRKQELQGRIRTVTLVLRRMGTLALFTTALLMILNDFGVAIGPLLAGLGIVGVAVGFGAQYLVKDLITGFFVVLEDQFRVGDAVKINEFTGTVEHMSLRVTAIRGLSGEVHTVPNGEIRCVTNFSRQWARAIADVPISRDAQVAPVVEALGEAGRRVQADPGLSAVLLEAPEVQGLVAMDATSATVRIWAKTVPSAKLEVERALRREVLAVLSERGLEALPTQRTVLVNAETAGGARRDG